MKSYNLRRVFVWEYPVRLYHWINAFVIVVLCVTGYLIGNPPGIMSNDEANFRFLFGWIRYIHFIAAYIFVFNTILRIYWSLVGNKYAKWYNFIPTNKKFIKELFDVIKTDILMLKEGAYHSTGHNALAGIFYFGTLLLFFVQLITGFALYADMSSWWFPAMFAWVPGMVGGDFILRDIHHITMWLFIIFSMIHIYLVFYHDYTEGRGEISSMGSGWKFIDAEEEDNNEDEDKTKVKKVIEKEVSEM